MENLIHENDKNSKVGEEPKGRKENIGTMEKEHKLIDNHPFRGLENFPLIWIIRMSSNLS